MAGSQTSVTETVDAKGVFSTAFCPTYQPVTLPQTATDHMPDVAKGHLPSAIQPALPNFVWDNPLADLLLVYIRPATAVRTLARDFAHHRIQRVDNKRNSARLPRYLAAGRVLSNPPIIVAP